MFGAGPRARAPGSAVRTAAHAKVNLGLAVTSVRPDGYHELCSIFLRLELADELTITPASGADDELVIEGDPDCPVDDNLVLRAIRAWRAEHPDAAVGSMHLHLRKHIPMAAGLAGGSSDAAATLRLLRHIDPDALDRPAVRRLAERLGADVPFFLDAAGAALVTGIGESIEPLPPPIEPLGVLLVTPPIAMATPPVFRAWDALASARRPRGAVAVVERLAAELRAGATPDTIVALAAELRDANDLWPAAIGVAPAMGAWREDLERDLGRPVLMTGSGSTLVVLFRAPADAAAAARENLAELAERGARITATASTSPYPPVIDFIEEGP